MRYFGAPGTARIYEYDNQADTPVGAGCEGCAVLIAGGDQGFAIPHFDGVGWRWAFWHRRCLLSDIGGYPELPTNLNPAPQDPG